MKRIVGLAALLGLGVATADAADATRGARLYAERCSACHSIDDNGAGPRHRGLFGRRAGTVEGFAYSAALKRSGIVWTPETVDRWLANPSRLVPGNIMVARLADDPADRADIVAYLRDATDANTR